MRIFFMKPENCLSTKGQNFDTSKSQWSDHNRNAYELSSLIQVLWRDTIALYDKLTLFSTD